MCKPYPYEGFIVQNAIACVFDQNLLPNHAQFALNGQQLADCRLSNPRPRASVKYCMWTTQPKVQRHNTQRIPSKRPPFGRLVLSLGVTNPALGNPPHSPAITWHTQAHTPCGAPCAGSHRDDSDWMGVSEPAGRRRQLANTHVRGWGRQAAAWQPGENTGRTAADPARGANKREEHCIPLKSKRGKKYVVVGVRFKNAPLHSPFCRV